MALSRRATSVATPRPATAGAAAGAVAGRRCAWPVIGSGPPAGHDAVADQRRVGDGDLYRQASPTEARDRLPARADADPVETRHLQVLAQRVRRLQVDV